MAVSQCRNIQFLKFKNCVIENSLNIMTVEFFKTKLKKGTIFTGLENQGKIEFKNVYEGAYRLQSKLRRYDYSKILSLYKVDSLRT